MPKVRYKVVLTEDDFIGWERQKPLLLFDLPLFENLPHAYTVSEVERVNVMTPYLDKTLRPHVKLWDGSIRELVKDRPPRRQDEDF